MTLRSVPRPRTFDDLIDAFLSLERRLETTVNGQLEQSQQMGRVIAALTAVERAIVDLRAADASHRGKFESVPEIVDQRIQSHDIRTQAATWQWWKDGGTKVLLGVLIVVVSAFLVAKLVKG